MKEYCLKHANLSKPPKELFRLFFITVDDVNKIIYCSIPKVSSTTWKRVLLDLRGEKRKVHVSIDRVNSMIILPDQAT